MNWVNMEVWVKIILSLVVLDLIVLNLAWWVGDKQTEHARKGLKKKILDTIKRRMKP